MTRPVVGLLRAYFDKRKAETVEDILDTVSEQDVKSFLGGVWALWAALESITELYEADEIDDDMYAVMCAQIEADLDECAEELGLERSIPIC